MPKRVSWSTTTVHEFKLGHNACSIPSTGGPSIGLVGEALASTTTQVDDRLSAPRPHSDQIMAPMTRIELLRDAGYSVEEIALFCIATNQCRTERHETEQEYIAQVRQQQYQAYLAKQQMMAMEMERQRQMYLHMQYQMQSQFLPHKYFRSRSAPEQLPPLQDALYASPPNVQVLESKRRRLSVEAILN